MRVSPAPGTISYSGGCVGCDFIEPYAGGTPATSNCRKNNRANDKRDEQLGFSFE